MGKKYKLVKSDSIVVDRRKLYRIKALKDINSNVKKGDLGGYVESELNLDQSRHSWVYDNARVFGNARVCGDARVFGEARVCGDAQVYEDAWVCDNAQVYGNAWVCGDAWVFGKAHVRDNARVFGDARVYGDAHVRDNARVFGSAQVCGDAWVKWGKITSDITNIQKNINKHLSCQLNILPFNDEIVLFKKVHRTSDPKVFSSCFSVEFKYTVGKYAEAEYYYESDESCAPGLHASLVNYWDQGDATIAVKIHVDDIITIQEGKVRCKKLFVLGEVTE